MVSIANRRLWNIASEVLILVALCAPATSWSQRAASDVSKRSYADEQFTAREQRLAEGWQDSEGDLASGTERLESSERRRIVENLEDEIHAEELRSGPNSAMLIEPLEALATVYQDAGFDVLAAALNQRALDIVRRTYGLHSLEQGRLIQRLIESARSIGALQSAWNYEQELLELAERNPDDLRTAEILHEIAAGRMDILERYRAGEFPAEIFIGCYYEPPGDSSQTSVSTSGGDIFDCYGGSRRFVRDRLLSEAEALYSSSINVLLENEQCDSSDLSERLMELARVSYLSENVSMGARSLETLSACQLMDFTTWMAGMQTYVQIADWELLHSDSRNASERALAKYNEAYQLLREQGLPQQSITQLLSPASPIVLPAFLPNPLESGGTSRSDGYIDVAFAITKYGKGKDVQIIGSSGNATRADERRLTELILRNRFRPRVTDGRVVDTHRTVIRYYLNE